MFRLGIVLVLALLTLPTVAGAKGPSEGTISGPQLSKTVRVLYDGQGGSPGDNLSQASGFFPAAFGQSPNVMLHAKPSNLGPAYTVVWTVPGNGGAPIRQVLYPYARGGSVSYTRPGQSIFGSTTHGGWYRDTGLKRTLVALGLPATAPSSSAGFDWLLAAAIGLVVIAIAAAAAAVVLRRQRGQRSPSTSSTELPAGSRT